MKVSIAIASTVIFVFSFRSRRTNRPTPVAPLPFRPRHCSSCFLALPSPPQRAPLPARSDRGGAIHVQDDARLGPHPRQGPWPRPADRHRHPHRIRPRRAGEGAGGVRARRRPHPIPKNGGEGAAAGGGSGDWQDGVGVGDRAGEWRKKATDDTFRCFVSNWKSIYSCIYSSSYGMIRKQIIGI